MAKSIAVPLAHRRASANDTASPVLYQRHSASTIMSGRPIPITANRMWKPSDPAISVRAACKSVMMNAPSLRPCPVTKSQLPAPCQIDGLAQDARRFLGRVETGGIFRLDEIQQELRLTLQRLRL